MLPGYVRATIGSEEHVIRLIFVVSDFAFAIIECSFCIPLNLLALSDLGVLLKQILQSLKSGNTELAECPVPSVARGSLLIQTTHTLVSAGTERMLLEFGKASWIDKARQQPDKVQQVIEKARTDGLLTTINAVRSKLDQPLPLGYCNVGKVVAVGSGVSDFQVGDRVASNGPHAELVAVPKHLCAPIPDSVSDEAASFTVLASIGLQGMRLANPTLGETFVVSGLGLIGLLTGQLLAAHGCRVLGLDPDPQNVPSPKVWGSPLSISLTMWILLLGVSITPPESVWMGYLSPPLLLPVTRFM